MRTVAIFACHDDFEQRCHPNLNAYFLVRLCRQEHVLAWHLLLQTYVCVFSNLSCQGLTYLLLEAFIKVTNDLVTFHSKGNVPLCVFQRYLMRIGPIEQQVVFSLRHSCDHVGRRKQKISH